MKFLRVVIVAVALVAASRAASAQSVDDAQTGVRRNMISANPIGLLFEWYNGEYERVINSTTTVAIAASSFSEIDTDDDLRYSVVDGIVRYYPSARALRGFSIGGSVGLVSFSDDESCIDFGCDDNSGTKATIGVRGDYVWILGRDQHFSVAAGLGAKRVLGNDNGTEGLPIGRLSIGYAWQ